MQKFVGVETKFVGSPLAFITIYFVNLMLTLAELASLIVGEAVRRIIYLILKLVFHKSTNLQTLQGYNTILL